MNHERTGVEVKEDPFAATADVANPSAAETIRPFRRPSAAERAVAGRDRAQAAAGQVRAEVADDRFDFRQFGHDGSHGGDEARLYRATAARQVGQFAARLYHGQSCFKGPS
jgi:hypothetical protein